MKLARYLARLGYGSRRESEALCRSGRVARVAPAIEGSPSIAPVPLRDPDLPVTPADHAFLRVDDEPLDPPPGAVWMLHKPAGLVCSTDDRGALVYDLLPARLRLRDPVVASVGRLDKETTGLLLLTDDGALLHRLTSPRSHLPRTYRVQLAEPLRGHEAERFASGTLRLDGDATPLRAARLEVLGVQEVRLTISEGRYHQVRRMFAALGNHVVGLHREALGPLALESLAEGRWRLLDTDELASLDAALREAKDAARLRPTGGSPPAP